MTSFIDLSREVRNEIYKLCLIQRAGQPAIFPVAIGNPKSNPTEYLTQHHQELQDLQSRLALGLLGANRLIRAEALPTFYGKNIWLLHSRCIIDHNLSTTYELREPFKSHITLFRRVAVSFDPKDIYTDHLGYNWKNDGYCSGFDEQPLRSYALLYCVWANMIDALKKMPLTRLDLDLDGCETEVMEQLIWEPTLLGSFVDQAALNAVHTEREDR